MKISPLNNYHYINFKANDSLHPSAASKYGFLCHTSSFMRDYDLDSFVQDYILENLYDKSNIKIVSAGCSSGEEAYSYFMMLDELKDVIEISGFDIDTLSVQQAQSAIYTIRKDDDDYFLADSRYIKNKQQNEFAKKFHQYFKPIETDSDKTIFAPKEDFKNCTFFKGDVRKIERLYRKNSVDVLLLKNTLYHIANKYLDKACEERKRSKAAIKSIVEQISTILKRGGIVVFGIEEQSEGVDINTLNNALENNDFDILYPNVWKKMF